MRHKKVDGVWRVDTEYTVGLRPDWHNDYTDYSECPDGVEYFTNIAAEVNGTHTTDLVTKIQQLDVMQQW